MLARSVALSINADTKLSDLIDYDCHLLLVLNRFNIPLGFGDKTVHEVCTANHVDMDCFISIAQYLTNPDIVDTATFARLNPVSILTYLRNSHDYFLKRRLPDLREKLEDILKNAEENHKVSILKFFNDYSDEVHEHMAYENNTVFPYIEKLLKGKRSDGFSINEFVSNHSDIDEKITDLKHLIVKYVALPGDEYKITNFLFDLFLSEEDLYTHCFIENKALVPIMRKIEKQLNKA
ncbi:MAG: hemerythrin domain-containing protein [Prevotellaceae bacterium]|jgi:regulator of cell morphogenesis and NO signaling|nr:hemerythrin domain-containing protein [Prevotellaceae bacterium]